MNVGVVRAVVVCANEDTSILYVLDDCGRLWFRSYPKWEKVPLPPDNESKVTDLFVYGRELGALDDRGNIWTYRDTWQGGVWDKIEGPEVEE